METAPTEKRWYAAKVQYNRVQPIRERLATDSVVHFIPEIISSLVFLETTDDYLAHFEQDFFSRLWIYRDPLTRKPSPIPNHEMEIFMFVCSAGKQGLTYLGDDRPEYHRGDRVRVTDGPFKGAEGHIVRIKKDRRLVVSIRGVAALATTYIHPQFLEPVTAPATTSRFLSQTVINNYSIEL
ncbi:MAG: KOW motif-containing protein [Bacteroidales bacterium]|nr:KOW motif-containing protein [Bacteroidales bacterium]